MTASSIPDLCGGVSPLPLHAYVAVILGEAQAPALSCCETVEEAWVDGGLTVRRAVTLCTFANGVVIRRTVEEDGDRDGDGEDGGGLEQDGADAVIEFIADIELAAPAGETALRELWSRISVSGKPARLLGWDAVNGWRVIGRDGQGGYRRLQAALDTLRRDGRFERLRQRYFR